MAENLNITLRDKLTLALRWVDTKRRWVIIASFLALVAFVIPNVVVLKASDNAIHVKVGVWLVNVEKVDLSANNYRLDFYLWFKFNPSEISLDEVRDFEFINGAPTKYEVTADESAGYLEYRVRGDFITSFDFSNYQFETHKLTVKIEHKNLNADKLVFESDPTSSVDPEASVSGWNLGGFGTDITEHVYGEEQFSRFIFSIDLIRPTLSSFIKSVLPVIVITTISLLAFFMSPQNFAQRITLGVTTLMSATTFHLSLISGIPPTGYLTFADRMMLSVYAIFLYNLATSVYIMRLVDCKKTEQAFSVNRKALRFLPVLIAILVLVQIIL
ncbi:MAG: hypothetical protein QXU99_04605 [Candidatus Bathyarchaeia archaeon]